MRRDTPLFIFTCSLQLTHLTCRLKLIMQSLVTHVGSSNHTGVLMTHLYNQRGQPHDSYQFFRLEASGYKIIQVVLPVGPSRTTKDTYRIFFEVTIFQHYFQYFIQFPFFTLDSFYVFKHHAFYLFSLTSFYVVDFNLFISFRFLERTNNDFIKRGKHGDPKKNFCLLGN